MVYLLVQAVFWGILSWQDIRTQQVSVLPCAVFGAIGLGAAWFSGLSFWEILGGVAAGTAVYAAAYASKGAVGRGDALCVGVIGIWNGVSDVIWILMCAMFLLILTAIPLLAMKKATWKSRLPMVPFLTAGFLLVKITDVISR